MSDVRDANNRGPEKLHHIALHCIYEILFPLREEELLDYSLCRGPDSPWCRRLRTKKALMLVSRNWSPPAAAFLYRDVVLRRVSSLIALAETLRQSPQHGAMIQILRVECFIPKSLNKIARDSLSFIFNHCPNMHTLYLGALFIPSYLTKEWPSETKFDQESVDATMRDISHRAPALRKLAFVADFIDTEHFPPVSLLKQSLHLVSFTFSIPRSLAEDINGLSFPDLKELLVIITRGFLGKKALNIRCLASWSLPSLTSLGLVSWLYTMFRDDERVTYSADFRKVLDVHGSTLEFLDFSACYLAVGEPELDLGQICPRLRHLVLSNESPRWPTFHSYSLHVDVWHGKYEEWEATSTMDGDREVVRRKADELHCGSLRYLSKGLHTMPHLPTALPPTLGDSSSADELSGAPPYYVHNIFGMRILETGLGLLLEDEYPTKDSSFLWRNTTPIPVITGLEPSGSDSDSDSDSDDESWTWDEPQAEDTSSDEDFPVTIPNTTAVRET